MKKILSFVALLLFSAASFAASITAADVDFGEVSIKGKTLPVTGSVDVTVSFSGLQNYSSLLAEVTEGDDNFYLETYSIYYGTSTSITYPVYYYLEEAGTFTGKVRFYGYDASSNEIEKVINVKVVAIGDAVVAKTVPFERINTTSDLKEGDTIVFVSESSKAVSGALNGSYLEAIFDNVKIDAANGKADVPETAQTFKMSKYNGNWQFTATGTTNRLLLDISGKGAFAYGEPSSTQLAGWGISISNGVASISKPDDTFPVEFNLDRFKPYKTPQNTTIQLYKKAGAAQEVKSSLTINPTTINFGDVALSATTKEVEINYTAENLTDDIVWDVDGTDKTLFEVKEDAYNTRTSGKLTITYKGNSTKTGSVSANLVYLTQDAKLDEMEGSFPISINLIELSSVSFKQSSYAVLKGVEKDLGAEIVFNPAAVANKGLTWKFSETKYFGTISEAGVFKATATGEYIVIATSVLDDNIQAKCTVNVSLPVPTSVELSATELTMHLGETTTLTATVKPEGTEKSPKFESDKTDIATVNKNGLITAKALGTAVITVSVADYPDVKSTCTVNVVKRTVESIAFASIELTLNVGSVLELNPTVTPAAAADEYTTTYQSSNEAVATVDANGKVTSVAEGDAVITATISDKSAQVTIHVVKPSMFAKVTDPSQVGDKDTIILALKSANIIAGARGNKNLTVLSEGVTITDTEAFADKAIRLVLGTEKNKDGFTLTPTGSTTALAYGGSGNDIIDANTKNYKFWKFVQDGENGCYVQNVNYATAIFKYYATNNAIKLYSAAGSVPVYAYVRKYVAPVVTGVDEAQVNAEVQKVIRDGQLLIIRNGETYTITGMKK